MSVNSIGVVYDKMTDAVELQILRDLFILQSAYSDLYVNDPAGKMDLQLLEQISIGPTQDQPVLIIQYKDGPEWPDVDHWFPGLATKASIVQRDLAPEPNGPTLDGGPHVGYYLRPQGRNGANLTELYLNRSHPRGTGVTDPLVVFLWS